MSTVVYEGYILGAALAALIEAGIERERREEEERQRRAREAEVRRLEAERRFEEQQHRVDLATSFDRDRLREAARLDEAARQDKAARRDGTAGHANSPPVQPEVAELRRQIDEQLVRLRAMVAIAATTDAVARARSVEDRLSRLYVSASTERLRDGLRDATREIDRLMTECQAFARRTGERQMVADLIGQAYQELGYQVHVVPPADPAGAAALAMRTPQGDVVQVTLGLDGTAHTEFSHVSSRSADAQADAVQRSEAFCRDQERVAQKARAAGIEWHERWRIEPGEEPVPIVAPEQADETTRRGSERPRTRGHGV